MNGISRIIKKTIIIFLIVIYLLVFIYVANTYMTSNRYVDISLPTEISCESSRQKVTVDVTIKNKTYYELDSKENYFLSYHTLDINGNALKFDNERFSITGLKPGMTKTVTILVDIPLQLTEYKIEVDMLKENEYWFSEKGNATVLSNITIK